MWDEARTAAWRELLLCWLPNLRRSKGKVAFGEAPSSSKYVYRRHLLGLVKNMREIQGKG